MTPCNKYYIEVTLKQLLQMALGVPKIEKINLSILHSFFDIILKKLGAHSERVEIDGLDAEFLKKLLHGASAPLLPINDDRVERIPSYFAKAEELENRVGRAAYQLESHLTEIRNICKRDSDRYKAKNWDRFCDPAENCCDFSEVEQGLSCQLVCNTFFVDQLVKYYGVPLAERIATLQNKIQAIHVDMVQLKQIVMKPLKHLKKVTCLAKEIEDLHSKTKVAASMFDETIIEADRMLFAKVNKGHIIALKRFLTKVLQEAERRCHQLRTTSSCENKPAEVAPHKCLSCTNLFRQPVKIPIHACVKPRPKPKIEKPCGVRIPKPKVSFCQ